jgi:hypothetical protein
VEDLVYLQVCIRGLGKTARMLKILTLCDTAHYTNNKIRSGWVIDEVECNS